jgi:SRSO17 transposase
MKLEEEAWAVEFDRWAEPFLSAFHHKAQRQWAPLHLRGLLGPGERKLVEPMAARVAPDDVQQLHHFVATSVWDTAPLERVLLEKADALVGGPDAFDSELAPHSGLLASGAASPYSAVGSTHPLPALWRERS